MYMLGGATKHLFDFIAIVRRFISKRLIYNYTQIGRNGQKAKKAENKWNNNNFQSSFVGAINEQFRYVDKLHFH